MSGSREQRNNINLDGSYPEVSRDFLLEGFQEYRERRNKLNGRVRCPVCTKEHKPLKEDAKPVCKSVSHNAIQIFVAAPCPICLEDSIPPPNIALPCGHVVCIDDFVKLGGIVKDRDDCSDSEESEESPIPVENPEEFMNVVAGAGDLNRLDSPEGQDMLEYILRRSLRERLQPNAEAETEQSVSEDDDSEDDESDEDEDTEFNLMPRRNSLEDEISDGSIPPLIPRVDEDSDDDSDMPPLHRRNPNFIQTESDSSRSEDDSDSDVMPGLVNQADDDDDDSSYADIPELVERRMDSEDDITEDGSGSDFADDLNSDTGVYLISGGRTQNIERVISRSSDFQRIALEFNDLTEGTRMIPYLTGVMICRPHNSALKVSLYDFSGQNLQCAYYQIPFNVQIVSDGERGIWTLGTVPNYDGKHLRCFNDEYRSGKIVRRVSTQSTLIQGANEDCWVHVKRGNADIEAGLWRFRSNRQRHSISGDDISADAKVIADGQGSVWILEKRQGNTLLSWHLITGIRNHQTYRLNVDFVRDSKLIPNVKGGVYVHSRKNNQWSLFFFHIGNRELSHIKECPKDSKIFADAAGNAWIIQKHGSSPFRILFLVTQDGNVKEVNRELPAGITMTGAI